MKPIEIICNTGEDHLMVHWPNGRVEFIGLWDFIKLAWWIVKNEFQVVIVDAKK